MKLCVLASSSAANCTFIEAGDTRLLVDAGLTARATVDRLALLGVDIGSVHGILVSHEHSDHIQGLRLLQRKHGLALYANAGTADAISAQPGLEELRWNIFSNGSPIPLGSLRVEPFSVPHDARDPVGFAIHNGEDSVGIVTDMGVATELVRQRLQPCRCLVLESNYDEDMLRNSRRPWPLIQRILGRQGHLSNQGAAEFLAALEPVALDRVYLAHLSADCNTPELAAHTLRRALEARHRPIPDIHPTFRDRPSAVWDSAG